MKKRLLSLVLCLVMVFSLFPAFGMSAAAADPVDYGANGVITNPDPAQDTSGNLHLTKNLAPGANGTYDITMESWATGSVETHKYNEQIPTDYILVADQSGSMTTKDVPTGGWTAKTTNWYCPQDPDTVLNTYYKETDANGVDHYYRVYRKRGELFQYHAPNTVFVGDCVDDLGWFQSETTQVDSDGANSPYWYNPSLDTSNRPIGNASDNHFYPLMISSQGGFAEYWIRFRFWDMEGTKYGLEWPDDVWYQTPTGGYFKPGDTYALFISYGFADDIAKGLAGGNRDRYTYGELGGRFFGTFIGLRTGMYVRQVTFSRFVGYNQLAYKDDNGVEHILMDMTYCDENGTPVGGQCDPNTGVPTGGMTSTSEAYWYGTLYTPDANQNITRLQALQAAMTEFVNTVSTQENDDGTKPNHRVAIVGFADANGSNTELLTGLNINTSASNKNGVRYNSISEQQYKDALLDVTDPAQLAKLQNAVQALDANGGTEGEYGLYMAKNILDKRELTKFTTRGGQEVDRLTIIVYFTDGTPGPYEYSNQYEYGNKVIDAAHQIKTDANIPGVEIYSIGTFGFADADPLTYQKHSGSNDAKYQYDPDYVGKMSSVFNNRYIYRIWLRNTRGYGDIATDTVADYMRTITTEFPTATQFVDPTWYTESATKSDNGVYTDMVSRVRDESNGNRRYFLCTDLSGLSRVFTTIGSEEASSSSTVTLKEDAVLHDTVNTTNFDTANASVSAYTVAAYKNGTFGTEPIRTWPTGSDELTFNKTTGEVTVSDFNYSEKYVNSLQDGEKLVVKITGLTAKGPGENMPSNDGNAYIKAPDAEANAVEIESPTLTLEATPKTYVIDFSAPMIVATQATKVQQIAREDGKSNGTFDLSGTNAVYQLKKGDSLLGGANIMLSGVDSANVFGIPANSPEGTTAAWNKITTVPASSVYFDDDLTTAIDVGTGSGYNADLAGANAQYVKNSQTNMEACTQKSDGTYNYYMYEFYGSGIDLYCTTDSASNYIMAKIIETGKVVTVRNYANNTRYNVPTVHFDNLGEGKHTLQLVVLASSNYKLDGIRIYNPVGDQAVYSETNGSDAVAEKNATFTNLHKLLVNKTNMYQSSTAAGGVLFLDDTDSLERLISNVTTGVPETPTPQAAYKTNSPNNEIYLNTNQGITFTVKDFYTDLNQAKLAGAKLMIGLSTADLNQEASITGIKDGEVYSPVDMYYELSAPDQVENTDDAVFTIVNNSGYVVSVTNLKVSGGTAPVSFAVGENGITMSIDDDVDADAAQSEPVVLELVVNEDTLRTAAKMLFSTPAEPETPDVPGAPDPTPSPEVTPDPTPAPVETPAPAVTPDPTQAPSVHDIVKQVVSNFVSSLFRSISRLFGN